MKRIELREGWRLQTSFLAGTSGESVSRPGAKVDGWHETSAPRTVLCALVKDGTYPDPRYWPNPFRVPDSSAAFNEAQGLAQYSHLPAGRNPWRDPWWYRVEFDLPADAAASERRVWLNLDALNYRADVWVNGTLVADREQLVGMFRRFRLDISAHVSAGANALAILIHPVDHPGDPTTQLEVYGPVRNFHTAMMNDVTEVMTSGYDCFPTVPDRNLGLIQEVSVDITGPVDLRDPFVRTHLDLPALDLAKITVSAELVNTSERTVSGVLEGTITAPDGSTAALFSRPTTLLSHETRLLTLTPTDAASLALADPQLWWPNTYGDQPLYGLQLRFTIDGAPSAFAETRFGLRRIDRELHELDGAHGFRLRVNGQLIFQRGGYVQPEMMFDWDRERVAAELRYFVEANFNYVVFEDIPNPPDWYLDLCDEYGLLFWNCFYDCYWLQYNRPWDVDWQVLEDCTVDLVKRYRNHPSLIIYMSQNEGETREDVYEMWRRTVLALDDTRFLVPSGSFPSYRTGTPPWFDRELPVGMNDYAPKSYGWNLPWVYYKFIREDRNWMFMIESGSASVPPLQSLVEFLPQLKTLGPNNGESTTYPLDEAWAHFGANSYYEWFDRGLRLLYGEPADVADYVWKAHLVAYDQHRAFFEAAHHRMWEITSGFGEWKINSAFPDVQWQVYDWFLRAMPSLYAIRKACGKLAVQLCPLDGVVSVINNGFDAVTGLGVTATAYDLQAQVLGEWTGAAEMAANSYREVLTIDRPQHVPVYFVKLLLKDASGAVVADNFYWLSPRLEDYELQFNGDLRNFPANKPLALPRETPCMAELADLEKVSLEVQTGTSAHWARSAACALTVSNPTNHLAFFIRLRLIEGDGGDVRPAYWSDNYFSLLPGESKTVTVEACGGTQVVVEGFNIISATVSL